MEHPIGEESAIYINSAEQSLSTTVGINADDSPLNPDLLRRIKKQLQDRLLDGPVKSMLGPVDGNVVPLIRRDHRSSNSKSIFEVSSSLRVADSFVENVLHLPLPEVPNQGEISEDQIQVQVFYELLACFSSEGDETKLRSKAKAAVWERLQPFCADLNESDLAVQENHVLEQLTDPHMTAKEALERGLIFVLSNDRTSAPFTYKGKSVTRAQCKPSVPNDPVNTSAVVQQSDTDNSLATIESKETKTTINAQLFQDFEDTIGRVVLPLIDELKVGFKEIAEAIGDVSARLGIELKTGFGNLSNSLGTVAQLLRENNKIHALRHTVLTKIFNIELNQILSRCKWVLDFSHTRNAHLRLYGTQKEHLENLLKETKYHKLLETLDEELRPTLINTPTFNTDAVFLIKPRLEKVDHEHALKFVTNGAETALRAWKPNCPKKAHILLLGQTIPHAIAPQEWHPELDADSYDPTESIMKYIVTQKATPESATEVVLLQNFIFTMLCIERMVTAWRVKLTLSKGDLFPLESILLVLECIRAPTNAQIEFIKDAVPTVHALLEAQKLIFIESDEPMSDDCLDGVYE